ncbi:MULTISPECIES: outer membrane beta-barrel protein [Flavobacteriaceae]|uniref:outer membrane beta-barrel protein n=1 Tax=Flavobacteriaceae TaxID=49546 RepID=UPI0010AE124B|nr:MULTISPECIES: outer membrane beta-barrel protein [Flavobacteriaceae]NJB37456.1 porin [Croceivirga sp. JEA036]TKD61381.1 porin [Flavobacterium sp. ASW18X]
MKTIISTKYIKNTVLAAAALFAVSATAQEEEESSPLSLSGSVDTYYRTALTTSDADGTVDPGTSFANETGFALGMANLIASYEKGSVGAVADVVFGPRGDDATGGYNLNQLYAYWNVSEGTTLTMGRFNTFLGYEVIAPAANFNYSTSYLFSNGPFSHVGLKADFGLSDDMSLMLAVMNVTDVNNNLTGAYSLGAQLGFYDQFINLYYDGGEALGFEIDYTGGFDLSDDFFLGINAALATNDGSGFYGAALYPQYSTSENFALGLRGEYFAFTQDEGDDAPVLALTLTGSYSVDNLIIKPEIRLDSWGNDIEPYTDNDLAATNSLATFAIAAIYSFD